MTCLNKGITIIFILLFFQPAFSQTNPKSDSKEFKDLIAQFYHDAPMSFYHDAPMPLYHHSPMSFSNEQNFFILKNELCCPSTEEVKMISFDTSDSTSTTSLKKKYHHFIVLEIIGIYFDSTTIRIEYNALIYRESEYDTAIPCTIYYKFDQKSKTYTQVKGG